MSKSMDGISFQEAMVFLDSCLSQDKKAMNRSFREFFREKNDFRCSVKEAEIYIDIYREINAACYDIAVKGWKSSEKPDYDQAVFSKYPSINRALKDKWIQNVNFRIFR